MLVDRNVRIAGALSEPRLSPYLADADGDLKTAIDLYLWNVDVAGALYEVLSIVEIVVRNSVDTQLRKWNSAMSRPDSRYPEEWSLDPAPVLRRTLRKPLERAYRDAERASRNRPDGHPGKNSPITHDDVVSQLSFGCWALLLPSSQPENKSKRLLWTTALVNSFPRAAASSASQTSSVTGEELVYGRLRRLIQLRNRVAHGESLLDVNLAARSRDAYLLLGYIDPTMRDLVSGRSRVSVIASNRPGMHA